MKAPHAPSSTVMILALMLCSACTGVSEKQLTQDPVISETEKTSQFVNQQRTEYDTLYTAYLANPKPEYLVRMRLIMALTRDELDRAEYFQKNSRFYGKGIDHQRWQSAGETYRLNRTTLCEMMVNLGKLHLEHGDHSYGTALLTSVVEGFTEEATRPYVDEAREYLAVLAKPDFIATAGKTGQREGMEN